LDYYYDLLALKEPAMRILFLLTRQFKLLLEVKVLTKQGFDRKDIASKTGLHPFVVGKYQEQAKNFSEKELRGIMEEFAERKASYLGGRIFEADKKRN